MRSQGSLIGKNNDPATGQGIWDINSINKLGFRRNAGKLGTQRNTPAFKAAQGIWSLEEAMSNSLNANWSTLYFNTTNCDIVVVAGGGGAGGQRAGGGGAGGMLVNTNQTISIGDVLTATIGAGGSSSNGSDSSMAGGSVSITSTGGGDAGIAGSDGGSFGSMAGGNGGSGGSGFSPGNPGNPGATNPSATFDLPYQYLVGTDAQYPGGQRAAGGVGSLTFFDDGGQ